MTVIQRNHFSKMAFTFKEKHDENDCYSNDCSYFGSCFDRRFCLGWLGSLSRLQRWHFGGGGYGRGYGRGYGDYYGRYSGYGPYGYGYAPYGYGGYPGYGYAPYAYAPAAPVAPAAPATTASQ
jgi:hypothetical protein